MAVDMRVMIALAVASGTRRDLKAEDNIDVVADFTETTSGSPIVTLTMRNGDVYNLTITKARKKDTR